MEMPARKYSPTTRRSYTRSLQQVLHSAPSLCYVDELDLASVERYQAVLEQRQWSVSSRRVALAAIIAFITNLEDRRLPAVPISPQSRLPAIQRKSEPRTLSAAEYWALLQQATPWPRAVALLHLLRHTGIPQSELTHLTLDDLLLHPSAALVIYAGQPHVDLQTITRRVSGRGDTLEAGQAATAEDDVAGHMCVRRWQCPPHKLPLDGATCRALVAYLHVRPPSAYPHLSFLTRNSRPLRPAAAQALVEKYAQRAGVMGANIRTLQATHRTGSLTKGKAIKKG
jgi:integrase